MDEVIEKRGRARKTQTEDNQERRRKRGPNVMGKRLAVNTDQLDFNKFQYRWINDQPARIHEMTHRDDWDVVTESGEGIQYSSDMGNAVSRVVGTTADGNALRAYLCRKPKRYYLEDQAEKQKELDSQLEQLQRGLTKDGEAQSDYVPKSGIRIE